jgi:hypothetical protein
MNPALIVAGIPWYSMGNRAPDVKEWFEEKTARWRPKFIWNNSDKVSLHNCWDGVEDLLDAIERDEHSGGAHLLLFHKDVSSRAQYRARLRPFHRVRFLPSTLLQRFSSESIKVALDAEVAIEENWHDRIKPRDLKHPLVLPNEYFATTVFFGRLWDRSSDTESAADIDEIAQGIDNFVSSHENREGYEGKLAAYRDDHDLFFKFPRTVDYHGDAGDDVKENWKYGFFIRPGFHYDVGPKSGQGKFELAGPFGTREFFDNVNIYPHGHFRE